MSGYEFKSYSNFNLTFSGEYHILYIYVTKPYIKNQREIQFLQSHF